MTHRRDTGHRPGGNALAATVFCSALVAASALLCCEAAERVSDREAAGPVLEVSLDERLFTVLCAAQSAGIVRGERIEEIEKLPPDALAKVSSYVRSHGFSEPDYCAYALILSDPPQLAKRYSTLDPVSPIASPIADFHRVLSQFYEEADLHPVWLQYLPKYEKEARKCCRKAAPALAGRDRLADRRGGLPRLHHRRSEGGVDRRAPARARPRLAGRVATWRRDKERRRCPRLDPR